jgi:hypothetical protein
MKTHYAREEDAREVVESYLHRWEVLIGLYCDPGDLSFKFQSADVIDRAPVDTHETIVHSSLHIHVVSNVAAVLHTSRGQFPPLPHRFALSPDTETMYMRYKSYLEGKEILLSMAYMCLTVLEASAGSRAKARAKAAKKYAIAKCVLDKLGAICTEKGGRSEARKARKSGAFVPLSAVEKDWVTQVIKALIRRVGEYAYDPTASLSQLTMNDFPTI